MDRVEAPAARPVHLGVSATEVRGRAIGALISDRRHLSPEQIEKILSHQRKKGMRFGEAAISLGLASADDVLAALSQQFHYPYDRRERSAELVALTQPFSPQAEAFRALRSQVMMRLNTDADSRRALAVISPDSGDGKSFFAANLAVTLAQLGGRTLLVDGDLRGPRQHEIFGVPNQVGLSSMLSGRHDASAVQQIDGISSLYLLPVGATPPNPLELLDRPAFALMMRELVTGFDHVVVDTPAAVYGADASVIASRCGAALILARRNESRLADLQELMRQLDGAAAQVLGVIVNEH